MFLHKYNSKIITKRTVMKIFTMCAAALSALLLAAGAQASDTSLHVSPYLSFKAGASFLNLDVRCNDNDPNLPENTKYKCNFDHKTSFSMRPAIGLNFYSGELIGIRTEVEWYTNNSGTFKDSPIPFYIEEVYENGFVYSYNFMSEIREDIKTQALMFNTYADFHTDKIITPYVGVGLGIAKNKNNFSVFEIDETTNERYFVLKSKTSSKKMAIDGTAGFLINFNDHIGLDLSATYYYFGTVKSPLTRKQTLTDLNVDAGLRITF